MNHLARSHTTALVRLLTCVALLLSAAAPALSQSTPADLDALRALITRDRHSSIHAVYRLDSDTRVAEVFVGYHAPTGAWYRGDGSWFIGRDPQGRIYQIQPDGSGEISWWDNSPGVDESIAGVFPAVALYDLILTRPELIQSVERSPAGSFVVVAPLPGGSRATSDPILAERPSLEMCIEIDPQGRTSRVWFDPPRDGFPDITYEYAAESPPDFPVSLTDPRSGSRLASLDTSPRLPSDFTPERVQQLHKLTEYNVRAALAAIGPNPDAPNARRGGGAPVPKGLAPKSPLAKYRAPLLAIGACLVLGGLIAIYRRSRA